ncbi:DUF2336 domain-containing protein [Minwuia sp.]|uniref:DUF2336 domain-containing protein n=1 Tax=Minwuia sp. TaxID=2493630 RepID=UPI003A95B1C2
MSSLFQLAHRKSREGRAQLYEDVWNLFENDGPTLNDAERSIMTDILRRLSHDVEMTVRRRLAERLAANDDAPPELAAMLANDQIEVAYPILMDSKALRDADLIEIIRHRTLQHQLATAMRSGISTEISDALAATGNEDVVVALLENDSATMSSALMEHLVAESQRVDRYQKPLLRRPDLPKDLAKRMYAWVSAALRNYIIENYRFDPSELDDNVVFAMNDAVRETTGEVESNDPSERLVNKLHAAGQLNIGFALKALRQGEVRLFEFALAKLAELRVELLRRLVYEPGGEAFAMACRSLDMDRQVFLTIFDLTRAARGPLTATHRQERNALQAFYADLDQNDALAVVRRWRQDPDFLSALNQLSATD